MASSSAVGSSPCGACKFLRRKCAPDCVFAPYFCPDDQGGPERFAAVHKVFGASNVSKLLLHVPVHDRGDTVLTVQYQAQARLKDPVYGCVAHIHVLQSQVACLQVQLMQLRAHHNKMIKGMNKLENQQWIVTSNTSLSSSVVVPSRLLGDHVEACYINSSGSPQSSIESTTNIDDGNKNIGAMLGVQECTKRQRTTSDYWHNEWSELQDLALRMMKD